MKIYLDIDGHVTEDFRHDIYLTPSVRVNQFDKDGNPNSLNQEEKDIIKQIWSHVAEDFAPFNVNVTTIEPAVLASPINDAAANQSALRITIGGWDAANRWGALTQKFLLRSQSNTYSFVGLVNKFKAMLVTVATLPPSSQSGEGLVSWIREF